METKLEDKYTLQKGVRFLTGSQALVRIPIVQNRKDKKNNLNTACYITGYRGSPLGAYDQQILKNIDYLKDHYDEWLGFRPTLPDFLPVIGPSKNHKNLFYSFGHHHLGWTLGAISGKIISKLIAGENTNLDLSAYKSARFS